MPRYDWKTYSIDVFDELDEWVSKPTAYYDLLNYAKEFVVGQPSLDLVITNVYIHLRSIVRGFKTNNNMIITAPTGSGKTETYRAIKEFFKVIVPDLPVFMVDVSQLTPSGFKGSNLEDVFSPLFDLHEEEPPAIVFLDEIDKRLSPVMDGFGPAVQNNLLSILEDGYITEVDRRSASRERVCTRNVLFIGLGSFEHFRKEKKAEKHIGFNSTNDTFVENAFTHDTLVESGASYEIVGRFSHIINYDKLNDEAIKKITLKIQTNLCFTYDCDLHLTDEYKECLRTLANDKYGCRTLGNKIRDDMLHIVTKAMSKGYNETTPVLDITLDVNKSDFIWREYTKEEKKILDSIISFPYELDEIDEIVDSEAKKFHRKV